MWYYAIIIGFLIILSVYVYCLPLWYKRPIIITENQGAVFTFLLLLLFSPFSMGISVLVASLLGIAINLLKVWIIIGVSSSQTELAFTNALSASRTSYTKSNSVYTVDNGIDTEFFFTQFRIQCVHFPLIKQTKKSKLLAKIFRKFLMNYSLATKQ